MKVRTTSDITRRVAYLVEDCVFSTRFGAKMRQSADVWQDRREAQSSRDKLESKCPKTLNLHTLTSSFFCKFLVASSMGEGDCLNVPFGPDALPRNVRTSPLVIIPRTPVPGILPGSEILFSNRSRWTEGNRGLAWDGGVWDRRVDGSEGCGVG